MKCAILVPPLALLLLLGAVPLRAANIYVSPAGGGDGSIASPTDLQTALDRAAASAGGDTIFLQKGTYPAASTFTYAASGSDTGSLRVRGGWDAAYTYQSDDPAQTVLDGQGARRVLKITAHGAGVNVTVTLESLTVQNGRTSDYAAPPGDTGSGAGISATNSGGARLRLVLEWCNVLGNRTEHADSLGGGLYLTCDAALRHVTVRNNLTACAGGGLHATFAAPYTQGLAPAIEYSMFWGNRTTDAASADCGGANVFTDVAPVFRGTTFSGLGAAPGGSGVLSRSGGSPTFHNCVFSANVANADGGALRFRDSGGEIAGCLFLLNQAGAAGDGVGGALATDDPTPDTPRTVTVVNSTFLQNSGRGTPGGGGAIYNRGQALAVSNSIFWDNGSGGGMGGAHALMDESSTATVNHSDVQGGIGGTNFSGSGNIDAAPYAGPAWDYPYKIAADSPCLDAGSNAAVPAGLVADFEGDPRIFGVADRSVRAVDMGWDEYYDGALAVTAPVPNTAWLNNGTARTIAWSSTNIPGNVRLSLWRGTPGAGGWQVRLIAASVPCTAGSYGWKPPLSLADRGDYAVVVQSLDLPAVRAWVGVATQHLQLRTPNRGNLYQGGTCSIAWSSGGLGGALVRIELYRGEKRALTIAPGAPNTGKYSWKVPFTLLPGDSYRVRVSTTSPRVASDFSNWYVHVLPAVTLTAPDGGESWKRGTVQTIAWRYRNSPGTAVSLDLYRGGAFDRAIAARVPMGTAGAGSFRWLIPATLAADWTYTVRVRSLSWPRCFDFSGYSFQITE